jgi:formate dehydrogenase major subunit
MVHQKLGTDVALINGMNQLAAKGLAGSGVHVTSAAKALTSSARWWKSTPRKTPPRSPGWPPTISRRSPSFTPSRVASIVYCMGITQHTSGVDNVKSLANLAMLCGNMGRWATGVNPLRGQNNVQGACDMGGLPNVYPAYQPVDSLAAQDKFEKAWGAELSDKVGLKLMDMMHGLETGEVKASMSWAKTPHERPGQNHVEARHLKRPSW